MFLFQCVKGKDDGGLILFNRRKSSSSKFVTEFALFYSHDNDLYKHHQFYVASDENLFPSKIQPFYMEQRDASCICILFEMDEGVIYNLFSKQSKNPLCRFRVGGGDNNIQISESSSTNIDNTTSTSTIRDSIRKVFQILMDHPYLMLFSSNLWRFKGFSFATVLKIFLEPSSCRERIHLTEKLRNFDVLKNLESFPKLEDCLLQIIEIYQNKESKISVSQVCDDYLMKLKQTSIFQIKEGQYSDCSGFLAMCRISLNGNQYARELACRFLSSIIEPCYNYDDIIMSIAQAHYECICDINMIIVDFLAELSVIETERMDETEMEEIFNTLSKLKSSPSIDYYLNIQYYWYRVPVNNLSKDFENLSSNDSTDKFGHEIPKEILYNAFILGRNRNVIAIQFFNFFVENMEKSESIMLRWICMLDVDYASTIKLRLYLIEARNHFHSLISMARKLIVGIPGILEKNTKLGIEILKRNQFTHTYYSLALLYLENVPGFPLDWERVLFWILKHREGNSISLSDSWYSYIYSNTNVRIRHSEEYFLNIESNIKDESDCVYDKNSTMYRVFKKYLQY